MTEARRQPRVTLGPCWGTVRGRGGLTLAEEEHAGEKVRDGVGAAHFVHWRAFLEWVTGDDMLLPGLIWRGQRRDWPLKPRLDRTYQYLEIDPDSDEWAKEEPRRKASAELQRRYAEQLQRFKLAAAGRRGVNPRNLDGKEGREDENDEWWALGQHHGLDTPLLDWTDSPFAALFFAFNEDSAEDKCRWLYAVYRPALEIQAAERRRLAESALRISPVPLPAHQPGDPASVARALAIQERQRKERMDFPQIRVVQPTTDENIRLLSQGGVFTQAPPGEDIESFVRDAFKGQTREPILLKIGIKDVDQRNCMIALSRMAINDRTLFPDLTGASAYVNKALADPRL